MSRQEQFIAKLAGSAEVHETAVRRICQTLQDDDLLSEMMALQARADPRPHDSVFQFFPASHPPAYGGYWGHCGSEGEHEFLWLPEPNDPTT